MIERKKHVEARLMTLNVIIASQSAWLQRHTHTSTYKKIKVKNKIFKFNICTYICIYVGICISVIVGVKC